MSKIERLSHRHCNKGITINNHANVFINSNCWTAPLCSKPDTTVGIHDFILTEYFKRYDSSHFLKTFRVNMHQFIVNDAIDYALATKFVVENIELFSDSSLYDEVLNKALRKFQHHSTNAENAFSQNNIKRFLDFKHQYGGINLMHFNYWEQYNELFTYYKQKIAPTLSPHEKEHHDILFDKIFKAYSSSEILGFLEDTRNDANFSIHYVSSLDFTIDSIRYSLGQESGAMNFKQSLIGYIADSLARNSNYTTLRPQCWKCTPGVGTNSHTWHELEVATIAAEVSTIATIVTLITMVFSYLTILWNGVPTVP